VIHLRGIIYLFYAYWFITITSIPIDYNGNLGIALKYKIQSDE